MSSQTFPRRWLCLLPLAAYVVWLLPVGALRASDSVDFNRDIRPILSDKCFKCHGPDSNSRQADLRLDLREEASHVLSPHHPDESELLRRVLSSDEDEIMPPADSKLSLSQAEIARLEQWISQGADYVDHWSFVRVSKPKVPELAESSWGRNAIDAFVLKKLRSLGIRPSPIAAREKLIRRLAFDLTGLPPTPVQITKFLNDKSDKAWERLIDEFLDDEAFGERMASDWLDVARYSDTYGYQVDRDRFVWPWRDWVIKAINENLPYDVFVTWQIAGDLLPNPTQEQILATTFNRLHPQKVEGGSVPEEFRVEYVADRNHTFSTAFLGLTMECARCHDHKYDPISQREYYQLFAFFNNIDESGLYSYFTNSIPTPTMILKTDKQQEALAELEKQIEEKEAALQAARESSTDAFEAWLNDRKPTTAPPVQIAHLDFEDYQGANKLVDGRFGKAVELTGDDAVSLKVGNFKRYEPFSIATWMLTPDHKERSVVFHRSRAWTDAGSRGYQLLLEDGKLSASLIHFWPGNAIRIRDKNHLPIGEWKHVCLTYDGSSTAQGLKLFVDGRNVEVDVIRDNLYKNITGGGGDNISIGERFRDVGFRGGRVDNFRVFDRQLTSLEVAQIYDQQSLESALRTPLDQLTEDLKRQLLEYYLVHFDESHQQLTAELESIRKERSKVIDPLQEIMVMTELPKRRKTYVLTRGMYDAPAEEVQAETPAVFPSFPDDAPRDRLGLARWLTDANHPLTARVAVNRFWRICFGEGLVRTPEDFGSQGEPPTHPALLDWLAAEFVESGWNVKYLIRLMVTSETYRQSSTTTPDVMARDPENKWLARAPSYRLPAEMIRDNALSVSGLLASKVGGEPAKPYDLKVSFKPITPDKGDGLYRRSLYTFWKRTAPSPAMMTLDASKRDICTVKRERTASPLQSFVLLNGPQFVEASRVLGEKLLIANNKQSARFINEAFVVLTSREPSSRETRVLQKLFDQQFSYYTMHPDDAIKLLEVGETPYNQELDPAQLAAATIVSNTIMNFDECVMKR